MIEKSRNPVFKASFTQTQIFLKLNILLHESFPRVITGPVHTNLGKRIGGFINGLIRVDGA